VAPPSSVTVEGDRFEAAWDGLRISVRVRRRADEPLVRLEGAISNERPDHRVRLHVGLPIATDRVLAGAPFELVERPLLGEGSEGEAPSPTWPARYVVLAAGTAVFHEGVFEYEVVDGRALAVTLLRCVGTISRERLATRPWPAGPGTPTPGAQMLGETAFELAVWPGASRDGLLRTWESYALRILETPAAGRGTLPSAGALLELGGDVELSGVRRRDDEVLVTVWNPRQDASTHARIADRHLEVAAAEIVRVPIQLEETGRRSSDASDT
jgi:alpha-mannosidase